MLRHLMALLTLTLLALPMTAPAQTDPTSEAPIAGTSVDDSPATSTGRQTLEDILARQRGEDPANPVRSHDLGGDALQAPGMGPLGASSDSDIWRQIRFNDGDIRNSTLNPNGDVLIQTGGMWWEELRKGPLRTYGGWLLLGTIAVLAVFYLIRGRIRIDGGKTGTLVLRFKFVERMAHWVLAGSFILLGFTGLFTLFGRKYLIPAFGHEFNSVLLTGSKFIHNNVSWAFMIALAMVFVMWVWHNIPDKTDIIWFKQAGGIIGNKHPPARKFNAGQKIIFWSVIVLGVSVSASGISLLFPFELPLFSHSFDVLNGWGVPGWFGFDALPVNLAPQEEMQFAQLWHAIVAFLMMAVILGHIYIGTLGMEGAYDAMGSGLVDENWAHQHHSLWLEHLQEEKPGKIRPDPAE
ncbi:formate dehydrogenase [Salipiger aestuarii]|uniref:Formate dehydrogenase subunit gamma n=1 Tax=Salipiger aestuarii TaxID=568098 RepID=A0A327YN68_9RHOB|nr:formate dehydrogenase subunit gamma [Salipiger aestuarii]EIE49592.1 formate dehydrogenase, gamma subunit [Citreicella sp. 357]KAA8608882.1 formate dehydrogenase [Salipiger aestuarii]KAB2543062.1 formate dehydrogenase [Salipiger aestuarii]RAK19669.1 formate dehydrogenase subunit gamma [Salipiger aestuarii]